MTGRGVVVDDKECKVAGGIGGRIRPDGSCTTAAGNHTRAEFARQHRIDVVIGEGYVRGGIDESEIGRSPVFGGPDVAADPPTLGRFHHPLGTEHGVDIFVHQDAQAVIDIKFIVVILDLSHIGASQIG